MKLPLEESEIIELRSSGALSLKPFGRWRLGEWIKTDRRMLFLQGGSITFCVSSDSFVEISPCEREYSFKKKRCLKIVFNDGGDNKIFWLITSDIVSWEEKFSEYLEDLLTEDDIIKVANHLGHSAEKILWHLYRRRHATISELTDIAGAGNHMDVLNIVRKEINQAAQDLIGRPILVFKPEGMDQKGRKIAYSWWFAGCKAIKGGPFCDIIDEGEFYRIVVEAPPNTNEELKDNRLCLDDRCGFSHSVNLPSDTLKSIHNKSYRNGILEICILKQS